MIHFLWSYFRDVLHWGFLTKLVEVKVEQNFEETKKS